MPKVVDGEKVAGRPAQHANKFSNVAEVKKIFTAHDESTLAQGLTALRNQLTVPFNHRVDIGDPRLLLVQAWLESEVSAREVLSLWEQCKPRQQNLLALFASLFANIITLLSSHYTYHALASPIVSTLLTPEWMARLNTNLTSSHNDTILFTLKLFNSLSSFAGGRERKALYESFAWDAKPLGKILYMRRKGKVDRDVNILSNPDIRSLYVLLLLSFVETTTSSAVKASFLEQRRENLAAIFKGLAQDTYPFVRKVLETCWSGIWSDPKVKRTLKISLFNEATLGHIIKLYDRSTAEGLDDEDIPADLAHHFLLAICSRPGVGVCFKDRGWYPRETADDSFVDDQDGPRSHGSRSGKVYNRILSNILKTLRVNEDSRQQELALRILQACPELCAGYWGGSPLTLEPRLSSKWIANISFYGSVVSQPVPYQSFLLPDTSDMYQPIPPSLSTIVDNILPSSSIKVHLTRGLQSSSALVQHCTALALIKCLIKYNSVLKLFGTIEESLEEDDQGLWTKRRMEVEREIRRRAPELQVVVAFAQQKSQVNSAKAALLAECAQRLLWLYHLCLPTVVSEARFDVGKLLQAIQRTSDPIHSIHDNVAGLDRLRQLHVLRLLRTSDQFSWSGKTGSRSNFFVLLNLYVTTPSLAIKSVIKSLLQHTLSSSIIFQHDQDELSLWMDSLPPSLSSVSGVTDTSHSSLGLVDDSWAVITFLDDCAQRCIKTPYRYIEDLQTLWTSATRGDGSDAEENDALSMTENPDIFPSPMFMTVLEQLCAKIKGQHLNADEAVAILSFARRLVLGLASKSASLDLLKAAVKYLENRIDVCASYAESPKLPILQKELRWLVDGLHQLENPVFEKPSNPTIVDDFVQNLCISVEEPSQRNSIVHEVVDWLHHLNRAPTQVEIARLLDIVSLKNKAFLRELPSFVPPQTSWLYEVSQTDTTSQVLLNLDFSTLFMQCDEKTLDLPQTGELLSKVLIRTNIVLNVKRAIRLVAIRFHASHNDGLRSRLLLLLSKIMDSVLQSKLSSQDSSTVSECLLQAACIRTTSLKSVSTIVRKGLASFLGSVLRPAFDYSLIEQYTHHWANILRGEPGAADEEQIETAAVWIPYMDVSTLEDLLDVWIGHATQFSGDKSALFVLNELLKSLQTARGKSSASLSKRIAQLIRTLPLLQHSEILEYALGSALEEFLPPFYDGNPHIVDNIHDQSFTSLIRVARERWSHRLEKVPQVDIRLFLDKPLEKWTDQTVKIIATLITLQPSARAATGAWLQTDNATTLPTKFLAVILSSFFATSLAVPLNDTERNTIGYLVKSMVEAICKRAGSDDTLDVCTKVVVSVNDAAVFKTFTEGLQKLSTKYFNPHIVKVGTLCMNGHVADSLSVIESVLIAALKWAVDQLSGSHTVNQEAYDIMAELPQLMKSISTPLPEHFVEPVVTAAIQDHLQDYRVMQFVRFLMEASRFKPASVNKQLQIVIQHPKFYALCDSSVSGAIQTRDSIVNFLHTLFHLHPENSCHPSHIESVARIYGGTLSQSDIKSLAILRLFESTRQMSIIPLLTSQPSNNNGNSLDVLLNLDANRMFRSCLSFPQSRALIDPVDIEVVEMAAYDPIYVILLFANMLVECVPTTALIWVQLFRTNVASLLIRALSSHDGNVRAMSASLLGGLVHNLNETDIVEKPHVMHILHLLRDIYSDNHSDEEHPPRVSAYTTLHLAHSLRGIFYPSNFIYPITARYLLQRPELDPGDVPMLYGMLYSAGDQWKKERLWIIRFLGDGMVGREEWRVLKRRHTWDLAASQFQVENDKALRHGILEFLANITCNPSATTSLVLKSALLPWIEIQIQTSKTDEDIAWIRILENVLSIVSPDKLETSTQGEWRFTIARCLLGLLGKASCTLDLLSEITRMLLRLSLLPGAPIPQLEDLLEHTVHQLTIIEGDLHVPESDGRIDDSVKASWRNIPSFMPPTSARKLWLIPDSDPLRMWGQCVEALWRASMTTQGKCSQWDALTCRLLLWRAVVTDSSAGEWARKEVLHSALI
ncbi:Nucleolar pre-ribosomal-associated protein 1 [Abortiporus biennis]